MALHHTSVLEFADGDVFVRSEDTDYSTPKLVTQWWKVNRQRGERPGHLTPEYDGLPVSSRGSGFYSVYHDRLGSAVFRLPEGDTQLSCRRRYAELMPPKGHPKAIWKRGAWHHHKDDRELGIGREGKLISDTSLAPEEAKREAKLKDDIANAQRMAEDWNFKGNVARDRGDLELAERHYARAQPWLDKLNRLLGNGDGSEA